MTLRKTIGFVFISISIVFSLANIFFIKITGAVVGISIKSSLLTIFTLVFFVMGLLFLGSLEKKIINYAKILTLVGTTAYMGHKIHETHKESEAGNKPKMENAKEAGNVKITAPYWTDLGRFQRTYRWDKTLDEKEEKYQIEEGLLKGLEMNESYGDPLKLNSGKDGGGGPFMLQPGTAREMGLKTYGSSNRTGADTTHGKELKKLIKKNNYDYKKMNNPALKGEVST